MIDNALTFVTKQLNDYLKRKLKLDHAVALSRVTNPNSEGKLFLSLSDIAEEGIIRNPPNIKGLGNEFEKTSPIQLKLQFLISVAPQTPYVEGMKYLSQAITFFYEQPVFTTSQTKLPEGIDKVSIEMMSLNADTKKALWQSLGANYQPSVVYKMRLVIQNEETIYREVPELDSPE